MPDELAMGIKAAEELAPYVREFAVSVGLFDPAREIVGGWTDRLQIRREVRRLEALSKAAAKVRDLGVPAGAIKDRLLVEILEGAADEDDPELSELWSNLLANAATHLPIAPAFPTVLRQLEGVEARLLDAAYRLQRETVPEHPVRLNTVEGHFDRLEWRHLDNLKRLALMEFKTRVAVTEELPDRPTNVVLNVTPFGAAFLAACTPPHAREGSARPSNDDE